MKNTVIMTIISGITLGLVSGASAETDKRSNPALIASISQSNYLGELRGIIERENDDHFVGVDESGKISSVAGEKADELQSANQPIDTLVTGKSDTSDFYRKFDSDGMPMAHHQEYPRPSIKNLAADLLEAIEINPYPDDQ